MENEDENVVWSAPFKRTIVGAHEQARRGCDWRMTFSTSVLNELYVRKKDESR